jgi:outer membrane immunogenic protein
MRRQLLAIVIAFSLTCVSAAARADGDDAKPSLLQTSNWTGFTASAGIGYGIWDAETTTDDPLRGCVSCTRANHGGNGWLGRLGLGYDYQFHERFIAGVLANYDFSDLQGTVGDAVFTHAKTSSEHAWFIGVRGGWLMTPEILNYWSVGYTQTHFSGAALHNAYTGAILPGAQLEGYTAGGWFVGSGLEVAVHDGWFWRGAVRYADYGRKARTESGIAPVFELNFDPIVGTATNEIVYKFGR